MAERFPARPTLTVVFVCAIVFWASCAAAYEAGKNCSYDQLRGIAAVSAIAALAFIGLISCEKARVASIMAASVAVGILLGSSQAARMHDDASRCRDLKDQVIQVEIMKDSVNYGFGEVALVRCCEGRAAGALFDARLDDCGALLVGERAYVCVRFEEINFSEDKTAWQNGACGRLEGALTGKCPTHPALQTLLQLRSNAIERIGSADDAHALLQALVCGYRRNVRDSELYGQFQTCGLAHLVAVSGAHLVIVCGLAASLFKRLRMSRPATITMTLVLMACYYVISGMPVSALRASIMCGLGLLSFFGKRRPSSLNAIGIGLFAIVASSPASSVSASLTLSALSTVGIVLFGPLMQAYLEHTPMKRLRFMVDALSLTCASSLLSQLYACSLFDQLPLVAPLANLAVTPLFTPACALGVLTGIADGLLGVDLGPLGGTATALSQLLAEAVKLLSKIPYACIPFTCDSTLALLISALAAVALWAAWPKPHMVTRHALAALAVVFALAIIPTFRTVDEIVMLDIGQGDSILVRSRGQSLLIDTGNQDRKLLHELARNHVINLDSVLITHADDDHCGSLDQLRASVDVTRIVLAQDMLSCEGKSARSLVGEASATAHEVIGVSAGDRFAIGSFTAHVIWPHRFSEEGGNADSLCILLEHDGDGDGVADHTALMTGDAEKEEIAEMLEEKSLGDIEVLKVGHHGSRNALTEEQAATLKPEIALISCGAHNRYGHPKQEILDILDKVGAQTFRTDQDGAITCEFTHDAIRVTRTTPHADS